MENGGLAEGNFTFYIAFGKQSSMLGGTAPQFSFLGLIHAPVDKSNKSISSPS